jgi:hypothetical protein
VRQFLSALPLGTQTHEITIGPSASAVGRGGLVSPVFPAFRVATDDLDPSVTGLLLCFPESPSALLTFIQNEMPRGLASRTMMSYGLASVVLIGEVNELRDFATHQRPFLRASELWPLQNRILNDKDIERFVRDVPSEDRAAIATGGLEYDAACQVRQLNVNLAFALHRASVYAPELVGAFGEIGDAAARLVEKLRFDPGGPQTTDEVRQHHHYVSQVLQVNAGLAMVISQTLGGTPPLLNSEYPVGEYGLLGIGAAARALWSFYHHLRRSFLDANHGSGLSEKAKTLPPFEPFLNWAELDYNVWDASTARLACLLPAAGLAPSPHLLHFSSRFGFHETEYTLGASWQSVHASSSREWHLLTVTHEFIHSQVRQITSAIYPDDTDWARLSRLFEGEKPRNALESMQVALIVAMQHYTVGRENSAAIAAGRPLGEESGYVPEPSPEQLQEILADQLRYFQEVVVHVLDFLYTFHGVSSTYLAAIWQSWSTVPSVTERIHDYLLRSLCALASGAVMPKRDAREAFRTVVRIAEDDLEALAHRFSSPVVRQAVDYLKSTDGRRRLEPEFLQAYYIARLTRVFFFDPRVATTLRADDLTALGTDGDRRYVVDPGEFPDTAIESPLAFLSDRFEHETLNAGPELEFASLWQLLLLTDPTRKDW